MRPLSIALLVSWGLLGWVPLNAQPPGDAAKTAFAAGYAAAQRGDLESARGDFARAARLEPKAGAAHAALGGVLLALGRAGEAVRELQAAQRLGAKDEATMLNLAVAYAGAGDDAHAAATYKALAPTKEALTHTKVALPPDQAVLVATALARTGDVAAGERVLREAAAGEQSTALATVYDTLGTMEAAAKDYAAAEGDLGRALALDPALAGAAYHLGSLRLIGGRAAEAADLLADAHAGEPAKGVYAGQYARALMTLGREAEAIELLRAQLRAKGFAGRAQELDLTFQLAVALQAASDPKAALPLFLTVLAARPNDAVVLTNTALAKVQMGDAPGAIALYLRALNLDPKGVTLREDLGVAYLQQADLDHALEQFRAGLALDANNAALHYDLALALKLKDDLAGAIPEFERAAALDPTLPDPPYTLGILYMQQGRFAEAAASLERNVALRPDNGEAWATLGSVYRQLGQPERAEAALRRAIALLPRQPSPHITLAAVLSAAGRREDAAAERKIGADLIRIAVSRQKADFGLDSGTVLLKRGDVAGALVQMQDAVEADPGYGAAHAGLAEALERAGRKAEAAEERMKAGKD